MLRGHILETFGFDPGNGHLDDAIQDVCLEHTFHPIHDYLKSLIWDGVPRLDSLLRKYLEACLRASRVDSGGQGEGGTEADVVAENASGRGCYHS